MSSSWQCELYDIHQLDIMQKLDPDELGTRRLSFDTCQDMTGYGKHLLEFGSRHHHFIYNGMHRWPRFGTFTCFPYGGGHNTLDYIPGTLHGVSLIPSLSLADAH
ncbi:hypothetical protein KP509_33G068200 [Ceratopteris richardii]|uniref:Uncharacterized protein n=2 Tax=Ceratopteris richardii TaxID=49495 RepID=A0A8T2QRU0_CERRI|nr:hypothetical protein KP509_33G068200 [Ceratopteris richardii]